MDGISPFLVILFLSSVFLSAMGIILRFDSIKQDLNLAKIDRDYWKKMYDLECKRADQAELPNNLR